MEPPPVDEDVHAISATLHTIHITKSKSEGLSERHKQLAEDGRHLTDDSCGSESTMCEAMIDVLRYAKEVFAPMGGIITHKKNITLYECQEFLHKVGGALPDEANKKVSMKPDGGILFVTIGEETYPILIVEDKVQGTNDVLFEAKKKRQATGNAIERGAKNIRGAEMIFAGMNIFPYVLFASGCDFHSCETIAKRIEMMNMGVPNHSIEVTPEKTQIVLQEEINALIPSIEKKYGGRSIASVFVKSHKWDLMKHGSSLWKKEEIVLLCCKIIDLVMKELAKK
jgi:hypothetical protein